MSIQYKGLTFYCIIILCMGAAPPIKPIQKTYIWSAHALKTAADHSRVGTSLVSWPSTNEVPNLIRDFIQMRVNLTHHWYNPTISKKQQNILYYCLTISSKPDLVKLLFVSDQIFSLNISSWARRLGKIHSNVSLLPALQAPPALFSHPPPGCSPPPRWYFYNAKLLNFEMEGLNILRSMD